MPGKSGSIMISLLVDEHWLVKEHFKYRKGR